MTVKLSCNPGFIRGSYDKVDHYNYVWTKEARKSYYGLTGLEMQLILIEFRQTIT